MKLVVKVLITLVLILACAAQGAELPEGVAQRIFRLCNQARRQAGLKPLSLDARLNQAATQHSLEMDRLHYFAHTSPVLEFATLAQRINTAGVYCLSSAENLHREQGYLPSQAAENAVKAWLASPQHRGNLLNSRFNLLGLGVSQKGDQITITQDFAYQAVDVLEKQIQAAGSGFHVNLRCRVSDGPQKGAVLYQGHRCANWSADPSGEFKVEVDLPGPGTLAIGQAQGERNWTIETELPVQ